MGYNAEKALLSTLPDAIIFDDGFSYKARLDRGEARAFKEWLAKNPSIQAEEYHKVDRTMVSFIMQVD